MNITIRKAATLLLSLTVLGVSAQQKQAPIMGWSSWNHFRVHIDEKMIKEQADALVSSGMKDAGYRFINIDDGYFGGRDANGKLFVNSEKFPSGMRNLTDYIHSKGLKAGIYTDAGENTCGSMWDNDKFGVGAGIFGHEKQDCQLFFKEWNFDFLKVDWCGGQKQKLDEEATYLKIIKAVREVKPEAIFNICRWLFPGEWAIKAADSWRISGDIEAKWASITNIIDLNADLAKYASPGHYNDMDMLQVGRGMSYDEDKSHFSMWCMMLSPLLAGNDLRNMSKETIAILTNKEMIAIHQDDAFIQAQRVIKDGSTEVWLKPLGKGKREYAIAILNRADKPISYSIAAEKLNIGKITKARDVWMHKMVQGSKKELTAQIPTHGIVVLRVQVKK